MGATDAVHSSGMTDACMRATDGFGVDIAFEAVGRNETVAGAIDAVRKGGTVTLIGNVSPEVSLPLQKVVSRQFRLQGTAASCGEYPQAIDLISRGVIKVQPLITAVAPLSEGARWFDRLHRSEPGLMKIVLTPNAGEA
jgi:L-iditol 2-dehydrogenase